jgi:hypothetical protein
MRNPFWFVFGESEIVVALKLLPGWLLEPRTMYDEPQTK